MNHERHTVKRPNIQNLWVTGKVCILERWLVCNTPLLHTWRELDPEYTCGSECVRKVENFQVWGQVLCSLPMCVVVGAWAGRVACSEAAGVYRGPSRPRQRRPVGLHVLVLSRRRARPIRSIPPWQIQHLPQTLEWSIRKHWISHE